MGLVAMRACEYRVCDERWGPTRPPAYNYDHRVSGQWYSVIGRMPDNPWYYHPQLQYKIGYSAPAQSTILRAPNVQ
eukprot:5565213-Lingulodinium_polyedra.AAC.1